MKDDGSRITKIVFLANDRRAAKVPRGTKAQKQWACPGCGKAVGADTLLDFESGWVIHDMTGDGDLPSGASGGRWWTKGICPHCFERVQFTKSGAKVIEVNVPGREMGSGRKTIIRKRGQ